jgi:ribosomal protein S18 acetylase RimI-like enzyme
MKLAAKTPPPFALRPVAPPDEGFLLRLYSETRAQELARTGWNSAQREAFLRQQFHARRADHRARFVGAEESVVMIEGEDAGVWMVWRSPAEIRLLNIELAVRHRGRGVGAALIRRLLAESDARALPVVLSVREENIPAQRLYRRLGFAPQARADGYLAMRASPKKG